MPNLTKRDLVLRISNETGIMQKDALDIINRLLNHIIDSLAHGQPVEFRNFGIFEVKLRKARVGRNPHRPEYTLSIPSHTGVKFKAGKDMKTKVMKLIPSLGEAKVLNRPQAVHRG